MSPCGTRTPLGRNTTRLKLYVAGESARTHIAMANLRRLVESGLPGPCVVEVVDVLEQPDRAERERVIATPTLLKEFPPPRCRIVGDLSDADEVLRVVMSGGKRSLVEAPADRPPGAPSMN